MVKTLDHKKQSIKHVDNITTQHSDVTYSHFQVFFAS